MKERQGFIGFGFRVFLYILIGLVVSDTLLYYLTDHNLGSSIYEAFAILEVTRSAAVTFTATVNAFVNLAVLAVVLAASLMMSHRIAGPMYRMEKVAGSLAQGDLTVSVNLRDKDYMTAPAEALDAAIAETRANIASIKAYKDQLTEKASELERVIAQGPPESEDSKRLIAEVKALSEALTANLGRYK